MRKLFHRLAALTALGLVMALATSSTAGAYQTYVNPEVTWEGNGNVSVNWQFGDGCWPGDPNLNLKDVHVLNSANGEVTIIQNVQVQPIFDGYQLSISYPIPAGNTDFGTWTFVVTEDGGLVDDPVSEGDSAGGTCAVQTEPLVTASLTVQAVPLLPVPVLAGAGALTALAGGVILHRRRSLAAHAA